MKKLEQRLICFMEANGDISEEDREVYEYALKSVWILGGNVAASVLIGIALGEPWYCLLFLLSICLLRSDAGGYHASNVWSCFILSCAALIASLLWIRIEIPFQTELTAAAALVSFAVIFRYAPLESENKPLDDVERARVGKRARLTAIAELAAGIVCILFDEKVACVIFAAMICCAAGYAGWFIQKKKGRTGM